MATLEEIVVQLTAESSQLRAEMATAVKATTAATDKMGQALEKFSENSGKNLGFFETSMASAFGFLSSQAVIGAFNFLKDTASALFGELVKGADSAQKQETALVRLANSMALSGQFSQEAQRSLEAYTGEMERMTGVADDVIASNLATLSSLTKLDANGLKAAQTAALDLSAALGVDLNTATSLVAKGIEGNVGVFSRYGIEIEKGASQSENFANVIGKLSTQFGGAAAGAVQTYQGAVLRLSNSYGNFTESLASSITLNDTVKAVIGEVAAVFDQLTASADGNAQALREGVAQALLTVINVIGTATVATDLFFRTMEAGIRGIILPLNAIVDAVELVKAKITGEEVEPFARTKAQFEELGQVFTKDTALDTVAQKVAEIGNAGEVAFARMNEAATATAPTVGAVTEAVRQLSAEETKHQEIIKGFATSLADQNAQIDSSYKFQMESLKGALNQNIITQQEFLDTKNELMMTQFESENAALEEAFAKKLITEEQYLAAQSQLNRDQSLAMQQASAERTRFEMDQNRQRQENLRSTFSAIASLSTAKNKELAAIGKAAAIAMATIDGIAAVQKALASAPPPFNFALAGLVGVATAANIAKIVGTPLATGIDSVPGVGVRDNFPAVLAPGERVTPAKTNTDLTEFLAKEKDAPRSMNLNITIQNMVPASREAAAIMVETLNDYFSSGGLKLVGALRE